MIVYARFAGFRTERAFDVPDQMPLTEACKAMRRSIAGNVGSGPALNRLTFTQFDMKVKSIVAPIVIRWPA